MIARPRMERATMAETLLDGVTIVELASPLTEYAGAVLASLGATVWLIEPPGGASTRNRGVRMPGSDSPRAGLPFLARNRGKRSVVIDRSAAARAELRALCGRVDAVLGYCPSEWDEDVDAAKPGLRVTVTDSRQIGAAPLVAFAASGGLISSGWPDRAPCNAPSFLAQDGAGVYAAWAVLIGLRARQRGAPTLHYRVPLEEAAVAAITPWTVPLHSYGMQVAGQGAQSSRSGPGPYPIYRTADGFVRVLTGTPKQWQAFVALLGSPNDLVDGPWTDPRFRAENIDALLLMCGELTRTRTTAELFHEGQRLGLTITPVYDLAGFRADAHVQARRLFADTSDPEFGRLPMLRAPLRSTPDLVPELSAAPALDDGRAALAAWARSPRQPSTAARAGSDPSRPLQGIRVLELGVGAVVPEAASHLALLGAEVIKIESRVHIDFLRQAGLGGYLDVDNCPTFNQLNLGVKSLAVDLSQADGVALVHRLAAHCDVVMENMRGPVVAKWGLDYAALGAARPELIFLSSQGLGDGPYGGYQTYGPNLQTFSGVTAQWAHPDDPYPAGTTLNHPDHIAGKQAVVAVLAAILRRDRTGRGVNLDAAQMENAAYLIADRFLEQAVHGSCPPRGNGSEDACPHGVFRCAGEDRWVAIAATDDAQWQALRGVVRAGGVELPVLRSLAERLEQRERVEQALADYCAARDVLDIEASLRGAGVCCSRVVTGDDLVCDDGLRDAGFLPTVAHPTSGFRRYTGLPIVEATLGRPATRRPPLLGEHTDALLYDLLNLSTSEVDRLMAAGVIGR